MILAVQTAGHAILDAMVAHLSADPTFVMPTRQYITGGDVAFDCDQIVVAGVRIFPGAPGAPAAGRTQAFSVWSLEAQVIVVRCAPMSESGQPPLASQLTAYGDIVMADGGALIRAALAGWEDHTLIPGCSHVQIGPLNWVGPEGGVGGASLTIQAQL